MDAHKPRGYRVRRPFVIALVLVVGLLSIAAAEATPNEASSAMTIRLVAKVVTVQYAVDAPPQGTYSKGDQIWTLYALRNARPQFGLPKGAKVGTDSDTATMTSPTRAIAKLQVALPGGTLLVQGHEVLPYIGGTLPVVGGTGRFANARGTLSVCACRPALWNQVYRLQLP